MASRSVAAMSGEDRVARLREDMASLRLKDPNAARDVLLLRAGVALLAIGVALSIAAYFLSHNTTNALEQRDALAVGLIGVAVTVAGGAVFLRYSLAQFLRFWLARMIYEQRDRDGT